MATTQDPTQQQVNQQAMPAWPFPFPFPETSAERQRILEWIKNGKPLNKSRRHWRREQRARSAANRRWTPQQCQAMNDWTSGQGSPEQQARGKRIAGAMFRAQDRAIKRVLTIVKQMESSPSRAPRRASASSGRPAARRHRTSARASGDSGDSDEPGPSLGRHPIYGPVNGRMASALDGDCVSCGRVLLVVNGARCCVWRPCDRWSVPS